MDSFKDLNPQQADAAKKKEGAYLVIAGAGTGKTRVLTQRCAYLVDSGVDPSSILLLTFTRKACEQMMTRAVSLLDARCQDISGGTFHGFCLGVLRRHAGLLGFKTPFTILDNADSREIIRYIRARTGHGESDPAFPKARTIQAILSMVVNKNKIVSQTIESDYPQFTEFSDKIRDIGTLYRKYKKDHSLMDYDDLLVWTRELFSKKPDILRKTSERYRFVMVDEYQDTNIIQSEIASYLATAYGNIMVVGDDCQSIYGFRGADWKNIMEFDKAYPDARILRLERNYRSTQPILDMSNDVMSQMAQKHEKRLYTNDKNGDKPAYTVYSDAQEEAENVAENILRAWHKGAGLSDISVLYRSDSDANLVEEELNLRKIPYEKRGGLKFLERAHVKDVLSHLNAAMNPKDAWNHGRILRLLDGIGQAGAQKIIDEIGRKGVKALKDPGIVGKKHSKGLNKLYGLISSIRDSPPDDVYGPLMSVINYYGPFLRKKHEIDYLKRLPDLDTLALMAKKYKNIQDYLSNLTLDPPNSEKKTEYKDGQKPLILSTIHQAKGLEWDTVYIIGLNEGVFPHRFSMGCENDIQEELRILYVAVTRAKRKLYLSRYKKRYLPYRDSFAQLEESRFIKGLGDSIKRGENIVEKIAGTDFILASEL